MQARLSQVHWGLVLKSAVLLYLATFVFGLVATLPFLIFFNDGHRDAHTAVQTVFLISAVLVIVVTGYGAWWVAHRVERADLLHGFLVGLIVALISFLLDLLGSREIHLMGLILYALMIASGVLGGVIGGRCASAQRRHCR